MENQNRIGNSTNRHFLLLVIAALISACSSSATPSTTATTTSATTSLSGTVSTTTSTLAISPSSVSLAEGGTYTFSALGGSGSDYTFTMAAGGSVAGTVTTSGYFAAASGWAGTTYIILTDSAGDETYATVTISSGSTGTTTSNALAINPSTITLVENQSYTFSASGGSGAGYTYIIPSGDEGSVGLTSGLFVAPNSWTGTTVVEVVDSDDNIAYATVTVSSNSGTTGGTVTSITGTLNTCEGVVGGSSYINNWQVNGTELRTINDANNYYESPIYCLGLSVAGQIPASATVVGVSVSIFLINQSSNVDGSLLESMNLIYGGSMVGDQKTLDLPIPGNKAAFPTFIEGGSTDIWSGSITPAMLNNSSFGINIQTYRGNDRLFLGEGGSVLPQVTIYYSM